MPPVPLQFHALSDRDGRAAMPSRWRCLLGALSRGLRDWCRRRARRQELRDLDDATLRDLGLSRAQARFDAERGG